MGNNPEKSSGFTLIELMITAAIAGILVAVGIPSFNSTISDSRLTSTANELVTALNLARSEAVKRGMNVFIVRKGAVNNNWDSGWTVLADSNLNQLPDVADLLLRDYSPLTNGNTLRTGDNYACWLAYNSVGLIRGSGITCNGGLPNDTFRLCDSSADTTNSRAVTINPIGRARTSQIAAQCP